MITDCVGVPRKRENVLDVVSRHCAKAPAGSRSLERTMTARKIAIVTMFDVTNCTCVVDSITDRCKPKMETGSCFPKILKGRSTCGDCYYLKE